MARYHRLFRLRFTKADPADIDAEFQFHLTMRVRELEARGHAPARARELALAQFGDIDDARRFCHAEDEERMRSYRRNLRTDDLRQDLRLAIRTLRRQPAFTLSTVLTLGVAIALAASAYGIVHAYLLRPLPYPDAERLVRVWPAPTREQFANAPSLEPVDWSVADSVFAQTITWNPDAFTVTGIDRAQFVEGAWVSPEYFSALGFQPAIGRAFTQREHVENVPVVILSDALWSTLFARDSSVIGRSIRVQSLEEAEGAELLTVVGIMPPDAWHVDRFTGVLRPLSLEPQYPMMARLQEGMSMTRAEERLNALVLPQLGDVDPAYRLSLIGVQQEHMHRVRPTLVALMGGALFLLLIAGASVSGVQTARAASRRPEMLLRRALGASRGRIMMQLLVESLVIALAASAIGALIAGLALSTLGAAVGLQLGLPVPGGSDRLALEPGMYALILAAAAAIGVTFGLLPAIVVTRAGAAEGSGSSLGAQRGSGRSVAPPVLRRSLLVAQIAFTMMLLVGAGLMARTILAIAATPLGFDDDATVKADLFLSPARYPDEASQRVVLERLIAAVEAAPAVRKAAASFPDPVRSFILAPVTVVSDGDHGTGAPEPRAAAHIVTPGYFELLDIPVLGGRSFTPQDEVRGLPVAIVSEELAHRLWPGENGIGRRIRTSSDSVWRTVVGVVGETRQPAEAAAIAELYVPYAQRPTAMFSILARGSDVRATLGDAMQRAVSSVDDGLGLATVRPLSDLTAGATRRHHALATVLSIFALLALALAMLGLYASLAYVVAQRRREIAIRVAVGADAWAVRTLIAREAIVVVAAGLVVGIVLSLTLTRLLASQLYGVTPTDPGTYVAIATLLGGSALVAALVPLRKAVRVHPAEIMRSD